MEWAIAKAQEITTKHFAVTGNNHELVDSIADALRSERKRCADIANHVSGCFWDGDGWSASDDIYKKITSGEPAYTGEEDA